MGKHNLERRRRGTSLHYRLHDDTGMGNLCLDPIGSVPCLRGAQMAERIHSGRSLFDLDLDFDDAGTIFAWLFSKED